MASPRERSRNNIRMGIFVTVAIFLALFIIAQLTDVAGRMFADTQEWTVSFSTRSGVTHLQPGSDVRIGGMRLGEVKSVEPDIETDRPLRHINVRFALDRRVTLYDGARIFVAGPLIGAEAWLDIPDVGDPQRGRIDPDDMIAGTETRGMLTMLLGHDLAEKADDLVVQLEGMMDEANDFLVWLNTLPQEYQDRFVPIVENLDRLMEDAQGFVATVRHENWPQWSGNVDTILERVETGSAQLNAAIEEGHGLMTDARAVIDENREQIRSIVDNFDAFSEEARLFAQYANEELRDQIDSLLGEGEAALTDARGVIQTLQQDYHGWAANLDEVFGNAGIAAQQIKLAGIEIRRSPWKLLYTPSTRELEHELLYEAARSFAVAAGDLKAASGAVGRMMDEYGDQLKEDEEVFNRMTRQLLEPMDRYQRAQQQLMDILFEQR